MFQPTADTYAHIVDDLAHRYSDTFTRAEVQARVDAARAEIEPVTRHPEFLQVLVLKHARDHLLSAAHQEGRIAKGVPEVLFVCEHNAGRSQMAAALAEHLSGGHVHVRSAGRQPTGVVNPVVIDALHEVGIDLRHAYPSGLQDDVVHAADIVVDMGCQLPEYPAKRHIPWEVPDPFGQPIEVVRRIRDDIETRVRGLLVELGVPLEHLQPFQQGTPSATAPTPAPTSTTAPAR